MPAVYVYGQNGAMPKEAGARSYAIFPIAHRIRCIYMWWTHMGALSFLTPICLPPLVLRLLLRQLLRPLGLTELYRVTERLQCVYAAWKEQVQAQDDVHHVRLGLQHL